MISWSFLHPTNEFLLLQAPKLFSNDCGWTYWCWTVTTRQSQIGQILSWSLPSCGLLISKFGVPRRFWTNPWARNLPHHPMDQSHHRQRLTLAYGIGMRPIRGCGWYYFISICVKVSVTSDIVGDLCQAPLTALEGYSARQDGFLRFVSSRRAVQEDRDAI